MKLAKLKAASLFTLKTVLKIISVLLALTIVVVIIAYIFSALPYSKHEEISEKYVASFNTSDFYSDTLSAETITPIEDNDSALYSRLWMLEQAQERIVLSTFDFDSDEGGKPIIASLCSAAKRGVEITIIIDGSNALLGVYGDKYFQALNAYENVEIYIYNPINFLKLKEIQTRLHDKYIIIDSDMYMLGGRNTTDLFLGDFIEDDKNTDRDLIVFNNIDAPENSIHQLEEYYESMIALDECRIFEYKENTRGLENAKAELWDLYDGYITDCLNNMPDWRAQAFSCNKISLISNPLEAVNKEPTMWYALNQLMLEGEDILITTPYIICGSEMYEDLSYLSENTASVRMIINDVNSGANPWGCVDYRSEKGNVKATGLEIYEYSDTDSLHSKLILIDDRISIVGSYNFDMRSTYLDTELMLVIDSEELNSFLTAEVENALTYCKYESENGEISYAENYVHHELSGLKKFAYAFLGVFIKPIRHLL